MLMPASADHPSSLGPPGRITEEAALDAVAAARLKSNSRPHICVLLQPLAPGLAQFVDETSRECDFVERMSDDEPGLNTEELFNRYRPLHHNSSMNRSCVACKTFFLLFQRADDTPEGFLQTAPGQDVRAAPGDLDPHGSGELLCGAELLQPETQHEGAGGGSGRGGCRRAAATLRLPQVRKRSPVPHASAVRLPLFVVDCVAPVTQGAAVNPGVLAASPSRGAVPRSGSPLHHPSQAAGL